MRTFLFGIFVFLTVYSSNAQFTPVMVTGFNNDAIAEGPPNSLATTTLQLDGASSNKVMYTSAFATFAGIGGGGLPDNGTIINGADTYQLAPLNANNALYIFRNETGTLTLSTPASFAKIRLLCLSTEGASALNIGLAFTDGTNASYLTNYSLPDWFNGTANVVLQGFGRCDRSAGPNYNADAYPTNPRMYYIEISLTCADRQKQLASIVLGNVSTVPNNAPFPNAVFFGVSGISYSQSIMPAITPCDCNGPNGSIALSVTGSTSPYTYSWNTNPVQTGSTASGLAPGNYTCTITDAGGCTSIYNGVVPLNNNAAMTALANPVAICTGGTAQLNANVTAGTLTTFTWNPGGLTGQSITVSPSATTTYTVDASNTLGCNTSAQVIVTVNAIPASPVANDVVICSGADAVLQIQNPQTGYTYNWYTSSTGGTPIGSGNTFTVSNVSANATYYAEAISGSNCTSTSRSPVSITVLQPLSQPVVSLIDSTFTSLTFSWNSIPGAIGYEVTTDGGATYQTPSSGSTGTTHTISGLTGNQTVTLQVRALGSQTCENSILSKPVSGTTLSSKEIFVPNVFTPNGDGKNDVLYVYGNYIAAIQLRIFNQWGEMIFMSQNIGIGWDGTHRGKQQPVGVYVYTLKVVLRDGTIVNQKGSINLLR